MALTWKEQLQKELIKQFGAKKGQALEQKYGQGFPPGYDDIYTPAATISDIKEMEELSDKNPLQISFYLVPDTTDHSLRLRLYQWQKPMALSDILPILENFDLRIYSECPYKVTTQKGEIWISDFSVTYNKGKLELDTLTELFHDAFTNVYFGRAENDGFNKLIFSASLSWREVMVLRCYAKYLRQVGFPFSQAYIEKALINNAGIARSLVDLFKTMHDPEKKAKAKLQAEKIETDITTALESVSSLDEDRIIRRILALIKASLRTNYFQTQTDKQPKEYLSIKFHSRAVPDLPLPVPLYEIFVYSPRFEAIHLRNAKVARGGIRWSDRSEDFRTEILGLMKAQVVKNAIIVPSGAKGGFVLKAPHVPLMTREGLREEVITCYKSFICGLLDLTDNIIDHKFIRPKNVVCYDEPDPYLVVAADKGTASFSDIANSLSKEYNFWLGDAFASGGETGYDHKKMGITARGAWESIKRHFREFNIDVLNTNITVVGIGDMSGDVFGNGMMYTNHIKLVGAFDHRHIFIDPDPDPEISYYERVRLFNLPTSSWEDYNPKLISKGGGVFKRSLKSITLTAQMKRVLGVDSATLTPNELIRAILKAPVDLLYNGGIGTYVKASYQTQADVGDRTNDYCRINGNELRCKVVGEGGNLGFTQLGRIEYSLNGGLINTDFIDNSAGVDCSDHEVNLKILLDAQVQKGELTEKKRNQILASLTDEVAVLVLNDNYYQALVMSFSVFHANKNIGLHTDYIKELETQGTINRDVEFLADEKLLVERKAAGLGLTRPELAVLLAYTKIHIKREILKSDLPEDPYLKGVIETAFPVSVRKKFKATMPDHRLHRDIIATQLSNQVINQMGITFVYRLQIETGANVAEIVRAHAVASHIFGTIEIQSLIESLDFKIPMSEQYEMLYNIRNLINLATRWFLQSNYMKDSLENLIELFSERIKKLQAIIPDLMGGVTKQYFEELVAHFQKTGLPKEIAQRIATYRAIYTTLNIIDVATKNNFDLLKTAKIYFAGGEQMNMLWFRDQIASDSRQGHWNVLARLTLRDELDITQRALTVAIINHDKKETDANKLIQKWVDDNKRGLQRWDRMLAMLNTSPIVDYTMFFIAIRELIGLIMMSQQT